MDELIEMLFGAQTLYRAAIRISPTERGTLGMLLVYARCQYFQSYSQEAAAMRPVATSAVATCSCYCDGTWQAQFSCHRIGLTFGSRILFIVPFRLQFSSWGSGTQTRNRSELAYISLGTIQTRFRIRPAFQLSIQLFISSCRSIVRSIVFRRTQYSSSLSAAFSRSSE